MVSSRPGNNGIPPKLARKLPKCTPRVLQTKAVKNDVKKCRNTQEKSGASFLLLFKMVSWKIVMLAGMRVVVIDGRPTGATRRFKSIGILCMA